MNNWVILFVRTGSEKKIVNYLQSILNVDDYTPFIPMKEAPRKIKGIVSIISKALFPGYVFIQTKVEKDLIGKQLKEVLFEKASHKSIYSLLHYGLNKNDIVVRDEERLQWESLLGDNYCISSSIGFIEGDKIIIISGALAGLECKIKQIIRHKREAVIEVEIMGAIREVKVMLEIIHKI